MRILLYTGKGGVGKTTVAAATAVALARSGRRTLVLSTDPAHSLGDSLAVPLGNAATPVEPNLDAVEVDPLADSDRAWTALRSYLSRLLQRAGSDSLASEEMLLLPGLAELFALLRILDVAEAGAHDVLVVDCAPTGETLSLLHYPERLQRLFEKALPTKRVLVRTLGRPIEKLTSLPMPEDRLFDDVLSLTERLTRLGDLLRDGHTSSLRLVTTPERIPVQETRRTLTWLSMYGYSVDAVVLNRVYPDAALAGYFAPWVEHQRAGVAAIEESFAHVPVFRLGLQPAEVVGLDRLADAAAHLYPEADPAAVHYVGEFQRVVQAGNETQLRVRLPEADKGQLDLRQDGADVLLGYRTEQRRLSLPDSLAGRDVVRARYDAGELVLTFD